MKSGTVGAPQQGQSRIDDTLMVRTTTVAIDSNTSVCGKTLAPR